MRLVKNIKLKISAVAMLLSIAVGASNLSAYAATSAFLTGTQNAESQPVVFNTAVDYDSYILKYTDEAESTVPEIKLNVADCTHDGSFEIYRDYKGKNGDSIYTGEEGFAEWRFAVPVSGLYSVNVVYYTIPGKGSVITREIQIDGSIPFEQARSVRFERVWEDEKDSDGNTVKRKDARGNDIRPSQIEKHVWREKWLCDSAGYIRQPLQFYLAAGEHTLRFTAINEPMVIHSITLSGVQSTPNYAAVEEDYRAKGYHPAADNQENIRKIQGEDAFEKSDATLIPTYDHTHSATEPNRYDCILFNTIGGSSWQNNGQWISWQFEVSETGLYKIGLKAIQNVSNGASSARRFYINGITPFQELMAVQFPYSTDFNMYTLGGEHPYEFYFEKGQTYTLTMEAVLGDVASPLKKAAEILDSLNKVYREILVLTGANPDTNRDYQFAKVMPDTLQELSTQGDRLKAVYQELVEATGMSGENVQVLKTLFNQIERMTKNPDSISSQFENFQANISSLATWIATTQSQPLSVDYLLIAPLPYEMPNPKGGFWKDLIFGIGTFLASFSGDYSAVSSDAADAIKVWVGNGMTGGRDQAQILKIMADNLFTAESGISVDLQLVAMGSLLPSTLAGRGPDVALTIGQSDIMNYAFRNAVVDVSALEGYQEIAAQFPDSALLPLSFGGKVYGLPETQTYPMMFYRKDILQELGIALPNTWQEVLSILPVLQKNQMNFALPSAVGTIGATMSMFSTMLFQNGGALYQEDGTACALDSRKSIEAFSFLTTLYSDYEIPVAIDFANRFRTGETPIGIADYSLYNQLSVFAPELEGIWDFTTIPGVVQEDGSIDRTAAGAVSGCIIMSKSKHVDNAWRFAKWWVSAEAQTKFGRELESVIGTAARYPAANLETLNQIPWSKEQIKQLSEQRKQVKGIAEYPGGYYMSRYVDFAFRDVINKSADAGKTIMNSAKMINQEITAKRREFNLPVSGQGTGE